MFDKERLQREIAHFKKQQENLSQQYQQLNGAIAALENQLQEVERDDEKHQPEKQEVEHMKEEQYDSQAGQ